MKAETITGKELLGRLKKLKGENISLTFNDVIMKGELEYHAGFKNHTINQAIIVIYSEHNYIFEKEKINYAERSNTHIRVEKTI